MIENQLKEIAGLTPVEARLSRTIAELREKIRAQDLATEANRKGDVRRFALRWGIPAAVALCAFVFGLPLLRQPTPTFADVVESIERVKSVQFFESRLDTIIKDNLKGPVVTNKVTILGRSKKRSEVVAVEKGDPFPEGGEWTTTSVGWASVTDLESGKHIVLDLKNKTYSEIHSWIVFDPGGTSTTKTKSKPTPQVDFYQELRMVPVDEAEHLKSRKIDGKRVIGFRTTKTEVREEHKSKWVRTYWVDPGSHLPVKIEIEWSSADVKSLWTCSQIIFDEEIDEKLFSTEPEGFEMLEPQVGQGIKIK